MRDTPYRWRTVRQRLTASLLGVALVFTGLALTGAHAFYVAMTVAFVLFFASLWANGHYAD